MIKFLFGIAIGILIFFFFVYFGGGKAVKKVGEELTDTGKKMEVLEEMVRKERDEALKELKKKIFKEEKATQKKVQ